jgi:peptide/nickel transport system permease protein
MGFKSFLIKKAIRSFGVFFVVITLIFIIPRLLPGGAFAYLIESPNIPRETRDRLIQIFDLDRPLPEQYFTFLKELFFKGNLGISFRYLSPVTEVIMGALPWTLLLVGSSTILASTLGIVFGAVAAFYRERRTDSIIVNILMAIRSIPSFWLGMVLLLVLGFQLRLFPLYGAYTYGIEQNFWEHTLDIIHHLTLPMLSLTIIQLASYTMIMRAPTIETLGEDFIVTAHAKGLPKRKILFKHAVRPAMLPVVTVLAINIGTIIGGALITETVFSYPGTGKLLIEAINMTDYPLMLGIFFYVTVLTLIMMFIAEILYAYLDPRIRSEW